MGERSKVTDIEWRKMARQDKLAIEWGACARNKMPVCSPVKAAPSAHAITLLETTLAYMKLALSRYIFFHA